MGDMTSYGLGSDLAVLLGDRSYSADSSTVGIGFVVRIAVVAVHPIPGPHRRTVNVRKGILDKKS